MFERVCSKLVAAGIRISCFGSAVANWSKDPRRDADFDRSKAELERAIPRMQALGVHMLRGMSFMLIKERPPTIPKSRNGCSRC